MYIPHPSLFFGEPPTEMKCTHIIHVYICLNRDSDICGWVEGERGSEFNIHTDVFATISSTGTRAWRTGHDDHGANQGDEYGQDKFFVFHVHPPIKFICTVSGGN
jgi:hypothetical protein